MVNDDGRQKVANALLKADTRLMHPEFEGLWSEILKQRDENIERQRLLEEERAAMQAHVDRREQELAEQANRMRRDFAVRENELESRIKSKLLELESEQKDSRDRIEAMRDAASEQLQALRERKKLLEADLQLFQEEKSRYDAENNKKLQTISGQFVGEVIKDLKAREKNLSRTSFGWGLAGGGALICCLGFSAFSIYLTSMSLTLDVSWAVLTFQTLKGAIFLVIASILSRYAFLMSKRYLDESLSVSEIVHDVSFGQLYVQSYGATAGWEQVKEAFSKWHHAHSSESISKNDNPVPEINFEIPQVTQLLETLKSLRP